MIKLILLIAKRSVRAAEEVSMLAPALVKKNNKQKQKKNKSKT
jgi:hypothetical protein